MQTEIDQQNETIPSQTTQEVQVAPILSKVDKIAKPTRLLQSKPKREYAFPSYKLMRKSSERIAKSIRKGDYALYYKWLMKSIRLQSLKHVRADMQRLNQDLRSTSFDKSERDTLRRCIRITSLPSVMYESITLFCFCIISLIAFFTFIFPFDRVIASRLNLTHMGRAWLRLLPNANSLISTIDSEWFSKLSSAFGHSCVYVIVIFSLIAWIAALFTMLLFIMSVEWFDKYTDLIDRLPRFSNLFLLLTYFLIVDAGAITALWICCSYGVSPTNELLYSTVFGLHIYLDFSLAFQCAVLCGGLGFFNIMLLQERFYPDSYIIACILRTLSDIETKPNMWHIVSFRRNLVTKIEYAATCIQRDLPRTFRRREMSLNLRFDQKALRIATAMRSLTEWLTTPMADTREHLIARLKHDLSCFATGNLDELEQMEPEVLSVSEQWHLKIVSISRTFSIALLPSIALGIFHKLRPSIEIPIALLGFVIVWATLILLSLLDPGVGGKISEFKELFPLFGKDKGSSEKKEK